MQTDEKNTPCIPFDNTSTAKDIDHVGYSNYRVVDKPLEARFAQAWQKYNDETGALGYLLTEGAHECDWDEVSVRDVRVAATVVQWLGSPSGQSFLRQCQGSVAL